MSLKCPFHDREVEILYLRIEEVKGPYFGTVVGLMRITVSKCPEFGCGYTIESDERGILIRDSEGRN